MKADFDRYEPYDNRPEIISGVVLVLVLCGIIPLMLYVKSPLLACVFILGAGAVMVLVAYMLAGRGKHSVEINGEKITFISGRKARMLSLNEISAAGYASEIVRARIGDRHLYLLHVEIRLKTGERIQLAKNLHPPKDVDTYKQDSYNAFVEAQPLPQLCRYINRQVLGIAEE